MVSESTHVTQQRGERPFAAVSSAPPAASGGDERRMRPERGNGSRRRGRTNRSDDI